MQRRVALMSWLSKLFKPEPTQVSRGPIRRTTLSDLYPDLSEEELKAKAEESRKFLKEQFGRK